MADQLSSDLESLRIDREEPDASGWRRGRRGAGGRDPERRGPLVYVIGAAVVVAIGIAVVVGLLPYLEAKIFKTEVAVTEIALVSPAHAAIELTSTGYVVPQTVSKVGPKVPGKVATVAVRQGQRVAAGDLLFEIDQTDQKAALAAGRSQVAAAQAKAQTARANLAETRLHAARARRLAEQGVGPASTAEDLEAHAVSLAVAVKAADAEVHATETSVRRLQIDLANYTLYAPIDGTIINKPPEVGEFVGPQPAGIATDMGGVEVADFASLAVETDVPEQRLHLVKLGGPCEITLDAFPSKRYRGEAYEIIPRVNRAKATVTVKVRFADDSEGALPDMSARVSFLSGAIDAEAVKQPPKLIVPGAALAERGGARVVFVIEGEQVRMIPITVGPPFGGGFEIVHGPPAGTRVVRDPPAGLADGQRIKERIDG
jgi:RND family efflux transporter MFP subunit